MILVCVGDGAIGASLRMRQAFPLLSDVGSDAVGQRCYAELPKSLYSRVRGETGSKASSRALFSIASGCVTRQTRRRLPSLGLVLRSTGGFLRCSFALGSEIRGGAGVDRQ